MEIADNSEVKFKFKLIICHLDFIHNATPTSISERQLTRESATKLVVVVYYIFLNSIVID